MHSVREYVNLRIPCLYPGVIGTAMEAVEADVWSCVFNEVRAHIWNELDDDA